MSTDTDPAVLKPVSVTVNSDGIGSTTSVSPGARSSEFILTLVSTIIGALMMAYGAYKGNDSMVMLGGSMSGVSTGAYSLSRGLAKRPT